MQPFVHQMPTSLSASNCRASGWCLSLSASGLVAPRHTLSRCRATKCLRGGGRLGRRLLPASPVIAVLAAVLASPLLYGVIPY
jgi:hypothetical protein